MYILESNLLKYIPKNHFFHITDLIKTAKKHNRKIGIFPISEKAWIDTGDWEQYQKVLNNFKFL